LYLQIVEGFDEGGAEAPKPAPIPDICSTYGYGYSPGHISILQQLAKDPVIAKNQMAQGILFMSSIMAGMRQYTASDCTKLGGIIIRLGSLPLVSMCAKAKDTSKKNPDGSVDYRDNIDTDFSSMCKGLNVKPFSMPVECNINQKPLGILNKKFSMIINDSTYLVPDNTYRMYTESDCKQLEGGQFISIDILKAAFGIKIDGAAFLEAQGQNVGFCLSPKTDYSIACAQQSGMGAAVTNLFK
jgi:hypothetical protein